MIPTSLRCRLVPGLALAATFVSMGSVRDAGAQTSRSTVVPPAVAAPVASVDSLSTGLRYRITLTKLPDRIGPQFPEERQLAGELVAVHGDSLLLRPHPLSSSVAVPYAAIDRLEMSRGVSRGRSAFENAVGGAIVGALGGNLLYERGAAGANFATRGRSIGTGAAAVASFGLVFGLLFPTERWKRVDRPTAR